MNILLILCLTLLIINTARINGQQCMDLMPPFVPSTPLLFCEEYSKYGCCSSTDDQQLRRLFNDIRLQNRQNNARRTSSTCLQNVKSFLCARCSPFSAEIFQRTIIQPGSGHMLGLFPSLCGGLCKQFVRMCSNILLDYFAIVGTNGNRMEEALFSQPLTNSTATDNFCNIVKIPSHKRQYCYPTVDSTHGESSKFTEDRTNITDCVCLQPLRKSLRSPIVITNANDDSGRLFIVEQIGTVKVILPDGSSPNNDFLNIKSTVYVGNKLSQSGLLGLTFHPNFKENHKLYIFYTLKKDNDSDLVSRVEEFRVNDTDINSVDTSTSRVILEISKYSSNHAGGQLLFGKDGYLYIFTGDDGGDGDDMEIAQDLFMLSGKVLRINVDVTDFIAGKEYSIPSDNPFAADESLGLPEIYAWGLRYPSKCSIDRAVLSLTILALSDNRIFCGDVGADTFEEVNIIRKKANYGWNIKEGTMDFCPECLRGLPEVKITYPIFEYRHTIGVSVVGGHIYRGCASPNLYGQYIFGDLKNGDNLKQTWKGERLQMCTASQCVGTLTNKIEPYILSFGESEEGEIYVLTTSSLSLTSSYGHAYKIVDPLRRGNPDECKSARPVSGISLTGGVYPTVTPRQREITVPTHVTSQTTVTPRIATRRRQQRPTSETRRRNRQQNTRRRNRGPERGNQRPRSRLSFIQRLFGRRGNNRNQSPAHTGNNQRRTNNPASNRTSGNQQTRNGIRTIGGGAVVVSNQGATVVRVNGKR
ncbi:HHIP-like protein 2 [Ruditapes philippinarum]|uniref:HHIP-like protein 2 n=1 Tax=Ruditapes philippinarum TaxID=129788 RepID=UPI00295B139E|nr:HHIP-like protein 2 [Ruditapes philippinarum]